nr:translation initiation factor IF-2-like [Macaca fascicularis]
MARTQGACARAPPPPAPRSSRQPAPLAPRPWSPRARLPRSRPSAIPPDWGHAGGKDSAGWCAGGPAPRATHAPSQQLGADCSEAVAQDTRRRLGPPTAPWPRAEWPGRGDLSPGTQCPPWPDPDPGGKGPRASPRVVDGAVGIPEGFTGRTWRTGPAKSAAVART